MLERFVAFIVFGLFIFSPSLTNWWQASLREWYMHYLLWGLLIALCWWIQRSEREQVR